MARHCTPSTCWQVEARGGSEGKAPTGANRLTAPVRYAKLGTEMMCPLCGARKARRACPGVGQEICAICCGTKRLVEIRCPSTCGYLQTARAHPAAVEQRQRELDVAVIAPTLRDLTERQQQLFFLLLSVTRRQADDPLRPLLDTDVADAASALAATYETSARGVIYEHQTQSVPAQRLVSGLQAALAEISRDGRERLVEREAPHALRAIERGVRAVAALPGATRTAYLELAGRVLGPPAGANASRPDVQPTAANAGLILPPD